MLSTCHVGIIPTVAVLFRSISFHFSLCRGIPVAVVDESLKLSPEQFQQRYNVKAPEKDDNNIVFYCRSGNRSYKALTMAQQLGFTRSFSLFL